MEPLPDIQVIFQDTALLVINKPAGLATLPDGYDPSLPHVKSMLEGQFGRLWIVHRLDKNTSGLLLLARTAETHRSLNGQFEQHTVSKVYHALVSGNLDWDEKTIDLPLHPNGDRQHRTVPDLKHGKPAVTQVKVLERFGRMYLVEAIPATGRTHQIRAHLSAEGLYILGDELYSPRPARSESLAGGEEVLPSWTHGIALHAWSLEVIHPVTGEKLAFRAPYPVFWSEFLAGLRTQAYSK